MRPRRRRDPSGYAAAASPRPGYPPGLLALLMQRLGWPGAPAAGEEASSFSARGGGNLRALDDRHVVEAALLQVVPANARPFRSCKRRRRVGLSLCLAVLDRVAARRVGVVLAALMPRGRARGRTAFDAARPRTRSHSLASRRPGRRPSMLGRAAGRAAPSRRARSMRGASPSRRPQRHASRVGVEKAHSRCKTMQTRCNKPSPSSAILISSFV